MEIVKDFLICNSSSSVSVICSKLEIPYNCIFPLLENALKDLGLENYRLFYSINTGKKILTFTEKNKKEIEEQYGKHGKICAVQRITEDINNLYSSELKHREQLIHEELKNGGLFIPRFSLIGGLVQERREYNSQKKLNFRPKKIVPEIKVKETKNLAEEVKAAKAPGSEFVLEEEEVVRSRNEPAVMPFNKIIDIDIQDLDDIMVCEASEVSIVKEVRKVFVDESSEEDLPRDKEKPFKEPEKKVEVIPKKRKCKGVEKIEKRVYRESIIPNSGSRVSKLVQPSLNTFFKK